MGEVNCYECKFRGTIPGDAHSRCNHPKVKQDSNPFGAMVDALSGKNNDAAKELKIVGDPRGIKGGWFLWPANFDPVWLLSCEGIESRVHPRRVESVRIVAEEDTQ